MRIFVAGGTGFLGKAIIERLLGAGHAVTALARNPASLGPPAPNLRVLKGSPISPGPWQQEVASHQAVINLTGVNIFTRWTVDAKQRILESRVQSTRNIVAAIPSGASSQPTLINASASGVYGFCGDEEKPEDASPGNDFLAQVCQAWEAEANRASAKARVITIRIGIVLGKNGGALARMLPAFRLGVAGRLGSGRQWFPWIHLDDLTDALLFLLETPAISGPVNLSAPRPVQNATFTAILGRILRRPTLLAVPAWVIRLALGELGSVALEGCRMVPRALLAHGFQFRFAELEGALREILDRKE